MNIVRSSLLAGVMVLGASGFAAAQDVIVIEPQQETIIREYIEREPVTSVLIPDLELEIGAVLPEDVEVQVIEAPELETQYEYVVVNERRVILEPGTRRVIRVFE